MNLIEITQIIRNADNVLILTHERPDGDAIGSVSALLAYYLEQGKQASVYLPEDVPAKYKEYLPAEGVFIESLPVEKERFDFLICLDCSDEKRLGLPDCLKEKFPTSGIINIDHHFDNKMFGNENYIDANACAVGEILFDIFIPQEVIYDRSATSFSSLDVDNKSVNCYHAEYNKMSKIVANNILLAIITDTGGLRFDNTTGKVFEKISILTDNGADYLGIIKAIFFRKSYSVHLLESDIALNHLNWNFGNRFIYTYLSEDLLSKYNVSLKDIEGLIDSYRVLDNALIAALITKRNDGFKISLRSNDSRYPVVDIAHALGGGGHKLAAGCSMNSKDISLVIKKLNELVGNVLL